MSKLQVPKEGISFTLPDSVRFQSDEPSEAGRVLVVSGEKTRNRDYWSGKPFRIIPSGVRLGRWRAAGGILLWMHNFDLPLGKGDMFLEAGKLWAHDNFKFHRKALPVATNNWIGVAVGEFDTGVIADLWDEYFLNAVSIHLTFSPQDEENILETDDEIIFQTSEAIELSLVTVGGDGDAHRQRLEQKMLAMGVNEQMVEWVCSGGVCQPKEAAMGGPIRPDSRYLVDNHSPRIFQVPDGAISLNAEIEEIPTINERNIVQGILDGLKGLFSASSGGSQDESNTEDPMSDFVKFNEQETPPAEAPAESVEQTAPETPAPQEPVTQTQAAETQPEFQLELDPVDVAQALANSPQALQTLAQAMARDEGVRHILAEAFGGSRPAVIRLAVKENGAPQQHSTQQATPAQQPAAPARQSVAFSHGNEPAPRETPVPENKPRRSKGVLTSMVRPT